MSAARALLDQARSTILSKSKPAAPSPAQSGELMAMAGQLEQIQKRAAELEAQGVDQPWLNAVVQVQSGEQSPARPASRSAEVRQKIAEPAKPSPAPVAVRPAVRPAAPVAVKPSPMAKLDLGHLRSVARGRGFSPADQSAARAELHRRGWHQVGSCWTRSQKS